MPRSWSSVSRYDGGGRGLQTQLWQRIDGAGASPRPTSRRARSRCDRPVWRTVGDPLWQGAWEGALAGLTVAVKDLFAIKGYRIGAGNPALLDAARPETDARRRRSATCSRRGVACAASPAPTSSRTRIAGDNAHYGTPPNGALPGALPGGSSSGPATAVATGQADIGLATDTAGSVRVPASYQGLWGLRTTHGLVPRQGLLPLAQSFDTVGWLTRDGDTLQRVVDWCLSYDGASSAASEGVESGGDRARSPAADAGASRAPTCRGASSCPTRRSPRPSRRRATPSSRCSRGSPPHPMLRSCRARRSATSTTTSCPSAPCRPPRRGATTASGCASTRAPSAPRWPSASQRLPPSPPRTRHPLAPFSRRCANACAISCSPRCCCCRPCPARRRHAARAVRASTPCAWRPCA